MSVVTVPGLRGLVDRRNTYHPPACCTENNLLGLAHRPHSGAGGLLRLVLGLLHRGSLFLGARCT